MDKKIPEHCLAFASPAEWRAWLEEHHAAEAEAWLLIRRAGASRTLLGLDEAVIEALCFGWIDGAQRPIDRETYALRFTPRKPRSNWSARNRSRAEMLIQAGRMAPAGLARINEAKENGRWEAAFAREDVSSVPEDLRQALEEAGAWLAFDNWPASQKKQYLYWLESAKRPATRQRRIHAIVTKASRSGYQKP